MSGNRTEEKRKYNAKTYTSFLFRYRTDSELAEALGEFMAARDISLNMLLTQLLCEHFKVQLPQKVLIEYKRTALWPPDLVFMRGLSNGE